MCYRLIGLPRSSLNEDRLSALRNPDPKNVITGYNTDVEHGGVVYHVQTEDKGRNTPIILSLVYTGGQILVSKRSPYDDLLTAGFSETALAERLKRQHRLICAAINAGRIEELKRRAASESQQATARASKPATAASEPVEESPVAERPLVPSAVQPPPRKASAYTVYDPRRQSPLGKTADAEEGLRISLLDHAEDFRSGDSLTLQLLVTEVSKQGEKAVAGAAVSVKVLGTTFRPQLYSVKTNREGVASVAIQIPQFTSGRAAILIRATAGELSSETRRVIHPG
jgi:hypothetical protein